MSVFKCIPVMIKGAVRHFHVSDTDNRLIIKTAEGETISDTYCSTEYARSDAANKRFTITVLALKALA